jgi:CO/xanthine dehydrogenase FAD-binding subunit
MPMITEYHRPDNAADALALLGRTEPRTVPLAGGTWLVPRLGRQVPAGAVVDLRDLGWRGIERDPDTLRIGPMATLSEVAASPVCMALADGILARTARTDATVNVRNQATVGGTVVVAPADSEFVLALLALDAELTVQSSAGGYRIWSLEDLLQAPENALMGGLITQIRIHLPLSSAAGLARVARTPSDHPIVSAVALCAESRWHQEDVRVSGRVRIALGGVGRRPLIVQVERPDQASSAVSEAIGAAGAWGDHRGSDGYRRIVGALLAKRALDEALAY